MSTWELYPYHVRFPRTADWWDSGGTWYQVSTWCITNFRHRWEYLDGRFMFESKKDQTWFRLKWDKWE